MSHITRFIFQGRVVELGIESLTLPNGETVELEIVRHPGGAAVVALDERQRHPRVGRDAHETVQHHPGLARCPERGPRTHSEGEALEIVGSGSWRMR